MFCAVCLLVSRHVPLGDIHATGKRPDCLAALADVNGKTAARWWPDARPHIQDALNRSDHEWLFRPLGRAASDAINEIWNRFEALPSPPSQQ